MSRSRRRFSVRSDQPRIPEISGASLPYPNFFTRGLCQVSEALTGTKSHTTFQSLKKEQKNDLSEG
jgi:hypothetical protein